MRRPSAIALALGIAATSGAEAKPPRGLEANVAYCVAEHTRAQVLPTNSADARRRLEKYCEDLVARFDRDFRREPGYAQASLEAHREVISDAIDCKVRWLGRPGTAYEDCIREALERSSPSHPGAR